MKKNKASLGVMLSLPYIVWMAVFTLILQVIYLVLLHRTIQVLDAEVVG